MSASPKLEPADKMQMRLMRESGVEVAECAAYYHVSVATAMRALAELRRRLGPENYDGAHTRFARQRARAHLFDVADRNPNNGNASREA